MNKQQIIEDLLSRGVANIIPSAKELKKLLSSNKKLNIYLGIDPTVNKIHLGHGILLRKLQKFVDLGHNVTFLIGDFTSLIGDTSDKDSERPILTEKQIKQNFQSYRRQAQKFLDFSKVKLVHNSTWLNKLNFKDVIKLTQNFSVGDFVSRELIKKRLQKGTRVRLDETLYPLMQGYDSYHLNTDIQIGGTDQTFNMQAGRTLQKKLRNKQSFIIAGEFLSGTDGRKMSKSWGNAIWLEDDPNDIFGKVMSIKDELIIEYYTLATNTPLSQIKVIGELLKKKTTNPMNIKKQLAHTIVSQLYSIKVADLAQQEFENVFQKGDTPQDAINYTLKKPMSLKEVTLNSKSVTSGTELKRLLSENAIRINNIKITDINTLVKPGSIIKIGKRRFINT